MKMVISSLIGVDAIFCAKERLHFRGAVTEGDGAWTSGGTRSEEVCASVLRLGFFIFVSHEVWHCFSNMDFGENALR